VTVSQAWRRRLRIAGEFVVLFGGLAVIDHLRFGGTGFVDVHPNPYWLPVLVMALAYGTEAGLVAAMLSSWIWLTSASQVIGRGDYLDRLLQLSLTPLLWFLVAALVGEVTNMRVRRSEKCTREADRATRNVERLSNGYQDLVATNRALQVRIAVEEKTTGRVVTLAADLASRDSVLRHRAIVEMIALAARTSDFTCYRMDGDGGVRVWLRGPSIAARPDILPIPLVAALRRPGRPLAVVRATDRALLGEIGVAAIALVPPDRAASVGCLILHTLPFTALNAHSIAEITEIGDWLPRLLAEDVHPAATTTRRVGHIG
jgi:hypothetical protein